MRSWVSPQLSIALTDSESKVSARARPRSRHESGSPIIAQREGEAIVASSPSRAQSIALTEGAPGIVSAAGLVTTLFGIQGMLALLALAAMYLFRFESPLTPLACGLVASQGFLFVILGHGITRESRFCMWLTVVLTSLIVTAQLVATFSGGSSTSLFMILIAPVVCVLNGLALRRLRPK